MTNNRKSIFDELTEDEVAESKSYYKTYHCKCWAFKQATKYYKRWRLMGNSASVIFASGGLASGIATLVVSLIAIITVGCSYKDTRNIRT